MKSFKESTTSRASENRPLLSQKKQKDPPKFRVKSFIIFFCGTSKTTFEILFWVWVVPMEQKNTLQKNHPATNAPFPQGSSPDHLFGGLDLDLVRRGSEGFLYGVGSQDISQEFIRCVMTHDLIYHLLFKFGGCSTIVYNY